MGFQEYRKRLFNSAKKAYKRIDIYGKDLTLTLDGEDKHTTYMGATITTAVMVFIAIYATFQLESMFKRERTTVNIKSVYEDLNALYNNYSLSDFGFDFALQVSINGNPVYDERYYEYEVENVNSFWAPDKDGVIKRT